MTNQQQQTPKNVTPLQPKLASKAHKPDAPHSEIVEQSLLAAILHNPPMIHRAIASIGNRNVFHIAAHKTMYDAMCKVSSSGHTIGIIQLTEQLERDGTLADCGNAAYINAIHYDYQRRQRTTSNEDFDGYIKVLKQYYGRWQMLKVAERINKRAYDMDADMEKVLAGSQSYIADIAKYVMEDAFTPISVDVKKHADDMENAKGNVQTIPMGIDCLQKHIGGLHRGKYHLGVAYANNGKTALGCTIAYENAKLGNQVAYFNVADGTKKDVMSRIIAMEGELSYAKVLTNGLVGSNDYGKYINALSVINRMNNLRIQSERNMTLDKIESLIMSYVQDTGLDLVFIDYAQEISIDPDSTEARYTKTDRMAYISNRLATIGLKYNVTMYAAAQAGKVSEGRMPKISEIEWSNAFAQHADLVLTMWKPGLYDAAYLNPSQIEIKISKNKINGIFGTLFADIHPMSTMVKG